jgi:hypothetical protein
MNINKYIILTKITTRLENQLINQGFTQTNISKIQHKITSGFCGKFMQTEYLTDCLFTGTTKTKTILFYMYEDTLHSVMCFYHDNIRKLICINSFCVNQLKQYRGGHKLLNELIYASRMVNYKDILLWAIPSAEKFYISQGFRYLKKHENMDVFCNNDDDEEEEVIPMKLGLEEAKDAEEAKAEAKERIHKTSYMVKMEKDYSPALILYNQDKHTDMVKEYSPPFISEYKRTSKKSKSKRTSKKSNSKTISIKTKSKRTTKKTKSKSISRKADSKSISINTKSKNISRKADSKNIYTHTLNKHSRQSSIK